MLTDQAERAVLGDVGGPPVADVVDELIEIVGGEPKLVAIVDLQARGLGARCDALDVFDREHAVGSGAAGLDPQRLLGMGEEFLAAEQLAGEVGAHIDHVLADRMELEHLVERACPFHLGWGGVGEFGNVTHCIVGDPPVLLLREVQQRNQRRLLHRVPGDDFFCDGEVLAGEVGLGHQRSTSPMIGSTLEMIATASAISAFCIMWGIVWRLMNEGPRTCIR